MEIRHLSMFHLDWNTWYIIYCKNRFEDAKPYFSSSLQASYLKHAPGSCRIYSTFYIHLQNEDLFSTLLGTYWGECSSKAELPHTRPWLELWTFKHLQSWRAPWQVLGNSLPAQQHRDLCWFQGSKTCQDFWADSCLLYRGS